jgi:hypothetical protein
MRNMNEKPTPNKLNKEMRPPKRRGGGLSRFMNVILVIAIVGVAVLFVRAEQNRRSIQQQLEQTSNELQEVRNNSEQAGAALAQEILTKLRQHIDVVTEPAPTVATITDVEKLRDSNEFYKSAKNGDHLIITEKRAILYDSERDVILDVVPVRITPNQGSQATPVPNTQNNTIPEPPMDGMIDLENEEDLVSPTPSPNI